MRKDLASILFIISIPVADASVVDDYERYAKFNKIIFDIGHQYGENVKRVKTLSEIGRLDGPDLDHIHHTLKDLSKFAASAYAMGFPSEKIRLDEDTLKLSKVFFYEDILSFKRQYYASSKVRDELFTQLPAYRFVLMLELSKLTMIAKNFNSLVLFARGFGVFTDFRSVSDLDSYFYSDLIALVNSDNFDLTAFGNKVVSLRELTTATHTFTVLVRDLRFVWDNVVSVSHRRLPRIQDDIKKLDAYNIL